jgi:DNA-binding NarL/FixJ family response regulator
MGSGAVLCHDGVRRNTIVAALELSEITLEAETDLNRDAFGVIGSVIPDVVVLDLTIAGLAGLRMVPTIHTAAPDAGVVAVAPVWMLDAVSRAARDAHIYLVESTDLDGLRAAMSAKSRQ